MIFCGVFGCHGEKIDDEPETWTMNEPWTNHERTVNEPTRTNLNQMNHERTNSNQLEPTWTNLNHEPKLTNLNQKSTHGPQFPKQMGREKYYLENSTSQNTIYLYEIGSYQKILFIAGKYHT